MLQFIVSNQTNPYLNIAVENYLLAQHEEDVVTLYLWKNHRTVVIGQNQNPYSECNVEQLEADGGYLMRRRTGGGAVYHDDGNLNFSFVASHSRYDQSRQFDVLRRAVGIFGIEAEVSGRNDVLAVTTDADGNVQRRKFSGNAFSKAKWQDLHHGTILIKGNMDDMQRYLRVRAAKLHKHGVSSVQSRVVNLSEINAEVTSASIVEPLREAFLAVYPDEELRTIDFGELAARDEVKALRDEFASDQWRLGRWRTFEAQYERQFDWGNVELQLAVDESSRTITDVQIASDALDLAAIDAARTMLAGASSEVAPESDDPIMRDILSLIY